MGGLQGSLVGVWQAHGTNWGPSVWPHHPPAGNIAQIFSGRAMANMSRSPSGGYVPQQELYLLVGVWGLGTQG